MTIAGTLTLQTDSVLGKLSFTPDVAGEYQNQVTPTVTPAGGTALAASTGLDFFSVYASGRATTVGTTGVRTNTVTNDVGGPVQVQYTEPTIAGPSTPVDLSSTPRANGLMTPTGGIATYTFYAPRASGPLSFNGIVGANVKVASALQAPQSRLPGKYLLLFSSIQTRLLPRQRLLLRSQLSPPQLHH